MQLLDLRLQPRDVLVALLDVGQGVARLRVARPLQNVLREDLLLVSCAAMGGALVLSEKGGEKMSGEG